MFELFPAGSPPYSCTCRALQTEFSLFLSFVSTNVFFLLLSPHHLCATWWPALGTQSLCMAMWRFVPILPRSKKKAFRWSVVILEKEFGLLKHFLNLFMDCTGQSNYLVQSVLEFLSIANANSDNDTNLRTCLCYFVKPLHLEKKNSK